MSNSTLINYTKISPNRNSPRNHMIDTITIHCVVGQCTVESLGDVFASPARQASSNYGIGFDGRIGMYVDEKDRSWCSSNAGNDNRAITIEVASDTSEPYEITTKAYQSLIKLLVDICKRNNIPKLLWKADKTLIGDVSKQNMTVHRWLANKSCPGTYLYSKHAQIAKEVNETLEAENIYYEVQKNDTLSTIASKHNTTYIHLATLNNLVHPYTVYVGQKLLMPKSSTVVAEPEKEVPTETVPDKPKESETNPNNIPSDWAKPYWDKAVDAGVFDGSNPTGPLTREQCATIFCRLGLIE